MSKEAMKLALDHLMNLQPILGNGLLEERQLAFIDPHIDCAITALQGGLAEQPAQQQEPVVCTKCGASLGTLHLATGDKNCPFGQRVRHSDCAPQPAQRKPLTDEQAKSIAIDVMGFAVLDKEQAETAMLLIRGTEAAHGIKENT